MRSFITALLFITYIANEVYAISSEGSGDGDMDSKADTYSKRSATENRIIVGGNNHGSWGDEFKCKPGEFVNKFKFMVEEPTTGGSYVDDAKDEVGVRGLTVKCTDGEEGTSKVYRYNRYYPNRPSYHSWFECNKDTVVTGFNVKYVPEQGRPLLGGRGSSGSYDDSAAIDINMFCSDGKQLIGDAAKGTPGWTSDAKWDTHCSEGNPKRCSCASGTSLCGIKTKVENYNDRGSRIFETLFDNTALNKIEFICCPNKNKKKNAKKQI